MPSGLKLNEIFKNDYDFAWRLLQAECAIHTKKQITMQDITMLSQLYMKAVEKLNSIQDQREQYFNQKMQKLMAKPFVIRCFNNQSQGRKNDLEFKRRQMEQILTHQNQKANPQRLHHMICQYGQKQRKVKQKIEKIMLDHNKNLQQRLKKRNSKAINRLSYLQGIDMSSNQKSSKNSQKQWENIRQFNPESSRTTVASQYIQINSP